MRTLDGYRKNIERSPWENPFGGPKKTTMVCRRAAKRGAKQQLQKEMLREYDEYREENVLQDEVG